MRNFRDAVWDFIVRAPTLGSAEALDAAFSNVLKDVAFTRFDALGMRPSETGPQVEVLGGQGLAEWNTHYLQNKLANGDPCIAYGGARNGGLPMSVFTWSDARKAMPANAGEGLWSEARSNGMNDALIVSSRVARNRYVSVRLITSERDIDPQAKPLLQSLAILYGSLQDQFAENREEKREPILTSSEAECLVWVARGKSDAEIAMILSKSPHTVHTQVERAKAKLGVATRVQAAVSAYVKGEIAIA